MEVVNKIGSLSDDEEDLNLLRMAALQSLKPKSNNELIKPVENVPVRPSHSYKQHSSFGAAQTTRHHHNRGYRNTMGRMGGRNGINPRRTNSNLISIQVIGQDDIKEPVVEKVTVEPPKLILPQDRYHKPLLNESSGFTNENKEHSGGNKFDRYEDNSDDSESDSDEISPAIIDKIVDNIDRDKEDNVNDLLGELDSVINKLERKEEEKDEILHNLNISDKEDELLSDEAFKEPSDTLIITEFDADPEIEDLPPEDDDDTEIVHTKNRSCTLPPSPRIIRKKSRSPSPYCKRSPRNRSRTPPRKRFPPISPLVINTEVLNTISMVPLSPRSAAFVLENRQILARRQINSRSPRRSRTRSRSRSLSPIRRRSRSPRSPRLYQTRRNSLSPRRRSKSPKFSPKRRSNSPRNCHRRYARRSNSPEGQKPSIHKRLGGPLNNKNDELPLRRKRSRSTSLSLSPSPDRAYAKRPLNESTGHINNEPKRVKDKLYNKSPTRTDTRLETKDTKFDPILEARKKKFESPVVLNKNTGIIKLKNHKTDDNADNKSSLILHDSLHALEENESEEEGYNINYSEYDEVMENAEDEQDQVLDLNPTLDDLWSDEESDTENEGRFKSRTEQQNNAVKTISIRNLTNKRLPDTQSNFVRNKRSNSKRDWRHKSRRSRSSSKKTDNTIASRTYSTTFADKLSKTVERRKKIDNTVTSRTYATTFVDKQLKPVEVTHEKKKKDKTEVNNIGVLKTLQENKSAKRKVKIHKEAKKVVENKKEISKPELSEIIIENEDDGAGDLRTELSRRRAQRLTKISSEPVGNQARLLKNALHEVVSAAVMSAAEGRLPIHMRLGTSSDLLASEAPPRERRANRSRAGKRKNRQAVQV